MRKFKYDHLWSRFQIDEADRHVLQSRNWIITRSAYVSAQWYDPAVKRCRTELLHRVLMNAGHGEFVDHANGDTLDNRRSNLRKCTKRQNQQNSRKRRTYCGRPTKNRLKGAHPQGKRWSARIRIDGRYHYLGSFDTEESAHAAYCEAARAHHGEFARVA